MVRISKNMALLTELLTQVNKTFGTKYMYRNAKRNKIAISSFQVTNFTQFAFLLSDSIKVQIGILCENKK